MSLSKLCGQRLHYLLVAYGPGAEIERLCYHTLVKVTASLTVSLSSRSSLPLFPVLLPSPSSCAANKEGSVDAGGAHQPAGGGPVQQPDSGSSAVSLTLPQLQHGYQPRQRRHERLHPASDAWQPAAGQAARPHHDGDHAAQGYGRPSCPRGGSQRPLCSTTSRGRAGVAGFLQPGLQIWSILVC